MLDLLVNAVAVPFGYTSEFHDSPVTYYRDSFICNTGMWTQDSGNPSGWSLLPDIVQSNTPPPSPLRRALSSSTFVFPEVSKSKDLALSRPKTESDMVTGKNQTMTSLSRPKTENDMVSSRPQEDDNLNLLSSPETKSTEDDQETAERRVPFFGELTWKLPQFRRSPPDLCQEAVQKEKELAGDDISTDTVISERTQGHTIGCDLRKIADQFELDHAKMKGKPEEADFKVIVPEVFTKCVSVSILCIVWWRLLNRMR